MDVKTTYMETVKQGLNRRKTGKVVVLLSGGVESTAAALLLTALRYEVHGLFINYSQPNYDAERFCVDQLVQTRYVTDVEEIKLPILEMKAHPLSDEDAFVPGRNTVMMAVAGAYAGKINADSICIGMMAEDIGVFGDNDPTHHAIMQSLLTHSLGRELSVITPTSMMTKSMLLRTCERENIQTVSCWDAKLRMDPLKSGEGARYWIETCGECEQCKERDSYART